MTEVIMTEFT